MQSFMKLGISTVEIILRAIEGLVGATQQAGGGSFRRELSTKADDLMAARNEELAQKAIILADSNNDGRIEFPEFEQWVKGEQQMVDWVDSLGHYWAALALSASDPGVPHDSHHIHQCLSQWYGTDLVTFMYQMDPRLITGKADAERRIDSYKVRSQSDTYHDRICRA